MMPPVGYPRSRISCASTERTCLSAGHGLGECWLRSSLRAWTWTARVRGDAGQGGSRARPGPGNAIPEAGASNALSRQATSQDCEAVRMISVDLEESSLAECELDTENNILHCPATKSNLGPSADSDLAPEAGFAHGRMFCEPIMCNIRMDDCWCLYDQRVSSRDWTCSYERCRVTVEK